MKLRILCARPGFRRAGVPHDADRTWPAGAFTADQVRELEAEPQLTVLRVADGEGHAPTISAEEAVQMMSPELAAELRAHFLREAGVALQPTPADPAIGVDNAPLPGAAAREPSVHPAGTAGAPEIPVVGTEPVSATADLAFGAPTGAELAQVGATPAAAGAVHPAGTAGAPELAGGASTTAPLDQVMTEVAAQAEAARGERAAAEVAGAASEVSRPAGRTGRRAS